MERINMHPNHHTVEMCKPGDDKCTFYCLDCKVTFQTGRIHDSGLKKP